MGEIIGQLINKTGFVYMNLKRKIKIKFIYNITYRLYVVYILYIIYISCGKIPQRGIGRKSSGCENGH